MAQYYLEILNVEQHAESIDVDKPLNINTFEGSFKLVEIPSKIEVSLNGESVSFRINETIADLKYNDQLLNSGGHYFLEDGDEITLQGSRIRVRQKSEKKDQEGAHDGKTLVLNIADLKEPKEQNETSESSTQNKIQKESPKTPAKETQTSIDISELLQESGIEKKRRQRKTKSQKKVDKLSGTKIIKVTKKNKKSKKKKGFDKVVESEIDESLRPALFGPLARLLAMILDIIISIRVYELLNNQSFNDISIWVHQQVTNLITSPIIPNPDIDIIKIALIYFMIMLTGNILFSVSPGAFLLGAMTKGTFLKSRIKAILRYPFDIISSVFPVLDISLLIGFPSFKEFVTRARISYQSKFLRYTLLPLFLVFSVISLFPYTITEIAMKDKFLITEYKSNKLNGAQGNLIINPAVLQNYQIDGYTKGKDFYIFSNIRNNHTVLIREFESISLKEVAKIAARSPFAKTLYPELLSLLENKKPKSEDVVLQNKNKDTTSDNDEEKTDQDTKVEQDEQVQALVLAKSQNLKIRNEVLALIMTSMNIKALKLSNVFPDAIVSYTASRDIVRKVFKDRKPVTKLTKYFFSNDKRAYFIDKESIEVYDIISSDKSFHPRDFFAMTPDKTSDFRFESIISNKAINGVQVLNYLDFIDPMIIRLRDSNIPANTEILKTYLNSLKTVIDNENPEKYQPLNETIIKTLKSL